MKMLYEAYETLPDGDELVRYAGPYPIALQVAAALRDAGFRADVRPEARKCRACAGTGRLADPYGGPTLLGDRLTCPFCRGAGESRRHEQHRIDEESEFRAGLIGRD